MFQDTLRSIAGIHVFPAASLLLFVVVFGVAVYRAFRMDAAGVRRLAALPLDDDTGGEGRR